MARTLMACSSCGHGVSQWLGRCPSCAAWGTIEEGGAGGASLEPLPLTAGTEVLDRLPTGFAGVDRVLGGGLVPGSVALVAGEPGIGKSTLLLQVAASLGARGLPCLYASGEESHAQVGVRARRLGTPEGTVHYVPGRELAPVLDIARRTGPAALVVDSIQAIRDPAQPTLPGGPAQVRACADALVELAKADDIAVVLAGQVTKDGDVAGPRTLEHAVDVVCSFDGDQRTGLRVLAGGKNRFGPEGEVAWFEMGTAGLREVDPAAVLATSDGEAGSATTLVVAGRRAIALEVQALAVRSEAPGRRQATGLDPRRFAMLAAVVERATGISLSRSDLYGTVAGGLRVDDTGADLAVAVALVSAETGIAPPEGAAFVGEVALTGVVRPAPGIGARLAAAAVAGVRNVYLAGDIPPGGGVEVRRVRRLRDALGWANLSGRRVSESGA